MPLLKPLYGNRGVIAVGISGTGTTDAGEPRLMVGADILLDPRRGRYVEVRGVIGEVNEDDSLRVLRDRTVDVGLPGRTGLPPGKNAYDTAIDLQARLCSDNLYPVTSGGYRCCGVEPGDLMDLVVVQMAEFHQQSSRYPWTHQIANLYTGPWRP